MVDSIKPDPNFVPATPDTPPVPDPQPVPTSVSATTPNRELLKVVDAGTGREIAQVIEADAQKGTVKRFAVEKGNLVRDGDTFVIVEEERAIRIDWRSAKAAAEASA